MVSINVLSLNVNGLEHSPIEDSIDKVPFDNPDLYVEFTQEDDRPINTTLLIDIDNNDYKKIGTYSLNHHKTAQNIITNVYARKNIEVSVNTHGAIPIKYKKGKQLVHTLQTALSYLPGQKLGFTKGGVYVKLTVDNKKIFLLNLHLPVDTKKENMGYDYRKEQLIKIINKISDHIDEDTMLFVSGDLNFRMNRNGVNQLTELLKGKDLMLKELNIPAGDKKTFTCKFKNNSSTNYNYNSKCRLTEINNEGSNNFKNISKNVQDTCGDPKRIPSRCDRFLIHSPYVINVSKYKSMVLLDSSDHNAIYTSFKVGDRTHNSQLRRFPAKRHLINIEPEPNTNSDTNGGRRKTRKHQRPN